MVNKSDEVPVDVPVEILLEAPNMIVPDIVFDPAVLLIAPKELYPSPLIVMASVTVKLSPTNCSVPVALIVVLLAAVPRAP